MKHLNRSLILAALVLAPLCLFHMAFGQTTNYTTRNTNGTQRVMPLQSSAFWRAVLTNETASDSLQVLGTVPAIGGIATTYALYAFPSPSNTLLLNGGLWLLSPPGNCAVTNVTGQNPASSTNLASASLLVMNTNGFNLSFSFATAGSRYGFSSNSISIPAGKGLYLTVESKVPDNLGPGFTNYVTALQDAVGIVGSGVAITNVFVNYQTNIFTLNYTNGYVAWVTNVTVNYYTNISTFFLLLTNSVTTSNFVNVTNTVNTTNTFNSTNTTYLTNAPVINTFPSPTNALPMNNGFWLLQTVTDGAITNLTSLSTNFSFASLLVSNADGSPHNFYYAATGTPKGASTTNHVIIPGGQTYRITVEAWGMGDIDYVGIQ